MGRFLSILSILVFILYNAEAGLLREMQNGVDPAVAVLKESVGGVIANPGDTIQTGLQEATAIGSSALDTTIDAGKTAGNFSEGLVDNGVRVGKGAFTSVKTKVQDAWRDVKGYYEGADVIDTMQNKTQDGLNSVKSFGNSALDKAKIAKEHFSSFGNSVLDKGSDLGSDAVSTIKTKASSAWNSVKSFFG